LSSQLQIGAVENFDGSRLTQHDPVELFTSFGENDSVMNMGVFVSNSRLSGMADEEIVELARKDVFF